MSYPRLTCPKCRRVQYFVVPRCKCGVCQRKLPKGEKAQIWRPNDYLECPYCGFKAHIDWWADRDWQNFKKTDAYKEMVADERKPDGER